MNWGSRNCVLEMNGLKQHNSFPNNFNLTSSLHRGHSFDFYSTPLLYICQCSLFVTHWWSPSSLGIFPSCLHWGYSFDFPISTSVNAVYLLHISEVLHFSLPRGWLNPLDQVWIDIKQNKNGVWSKYRWPGFGRTNVDGGTDATHYNV